MNAKKISTNDNVMKKVTHLCGTMKAIANLFEVPAVAQHTSDFKGDVPRLQISHFYVDSMSSDNFACWVFTTNAA